ncbi:hypothetical protein [Sphingomonas baiyangensis]|uniref:Uncharacterized protein n=1 Tax=Sphingomonas baiyangensis TaxID=2572576 RepID=A0A4U1L164_9SPHN|nr:hypothetical protein [Sphingomonas baiyangensis]TKD50551.1 hypothetical protein FBR43_07080 [Sphingomonas baiyangensis]
MEPILVGLSCGLLGLVTGGIATTLMAGDAVQVARENADKWHTLFKRAVGDLGRVCCERDELRLRAQTAERKIEEMRPLHEIGQKRHAIVQKRNVKMRERRRGDDDDLVIELLNEGHPVTRDEVMGLLGCDNRRAGWLLKSVGAVSDTDEVGKVTYTLPAKAKAA